MQKKSLKLVLSNVLPLAILVGCAHRQPETAAAYSELPAPALSATSDSSEQRVYDATITVPGGGSGSITHGSTQASGPNRDLVENIRQTVLSDPKLVPYPSKVVASMDPDSAGKVILTGSVQTQGTKERLVKHIRQMPGVTGVEDKLVLEVPETSREVNPQQIPK